MVLPCPDLRFFGRDDEEKAVCWSETFGQEPCVIFSVGSNNQWTFEESVVAETSCKVKTFDCTIPHADMPEQLMPRVQFHNLCLWGHRKGRKQGKEFVDYATMVEEAGGVFPKYLKMDIEGFEFESLTAALENLESSNKPAQIAVEIHFQNAYFDMDEEGLLSFSNFMFHHGYVLAHRRDNRYGYMATEVLFVRVSC